MNAVKEAFFKAIVKFLKPAVRILIEHGISHAEFCEAAKQAYVGVADEHFKIPKKKQTASRLSALTGLHRLDVARIKKEIEEETSKPQKNRQEDVVVGWINDSDFHDKQGKPLPLPREGEGSFTELVKKYAGDIPVVSILTELVRVGVCKETDKVVTLMTDGYIPKKSDIEKIRFMGNHSADLMSTLAFNLSKEHKDTRVQMVSCFTSLTPEEIAGFRQHTQESAREFLRKLDKDLTARTSVNKADGSIRAGLGLYYFEDEETEIKK